MVIRLGTDHLRPRTEHIVGQRPTATRNPWVECVQTTLAQLPEGARATQEPLQARLRCRTGGAEHDVRYCFQCDRFASWEPTADGKAIAVHCWGHEHAPWTADDQVGEIMTPERRLAIVPTGTDAVAADEAAAALGVRHLLVLNDDELVGVVCRCDLFSATGACVDDCMTDLIVATDPRQSLLEAADIMAAEHVGCLPVVEQSAVTGLVTRGDLRRAGLPEDRLGATECASCGSVHGVRPHPRMPDIEFCLDCLEVEATKIEDSELGTGD